MYITCDITWIKSTDPVINTVRLTWKLYDNKIRLQAEKPKIGNLRPESSNLAQKTTIDPTALWVAASV